MDKATLTQEQANALEAALKKESADAILKSAAREWETWFNECQELNYMDLPTIAKALYAGYEVEEKFNPGDKVITKKGGELVVLSNPMLNKPAWFIMDNFDKAKFIYTKDFRLATTEEIYWLETLGRKEIMDFREGDIYVDNADQANRLFMDAGTYNHKVTIEDAKCNYENRIFKGIYPAESFKPFTKER